MIATSIKMKKHKETKGNYFFLGVRPSLNLLERSSCRRWRVDLTGRRAWRGWRRRFP